MGRLTPYFEKKLTESNLIIGEKGTVSNSTAEEVYKQVNRYIDSNNKILTNGEIVSYELRARRFVMRRNTYNLIRNIAVAVIVLAVFLYAMGLIHFSWT